ncbi:MAG: chlorophyll synthase ChlG [Ahrensia sp.]|nr:chlorophyll synthase ChlG [Ahrensia sp.]
MKSNSLAGSTLTPMRTLPTPGAVLELLKPITWFPPMWAYACGAVSIGGAISDRWLYVLGGILLAGPLICGTSQAVNDWFDRHVDAINEPNRVIPSGRMPGRWGLYVAIIATIISLSVASLLGLWVFVAAVIGLALAWAYSAPPLRLKQNGWLGCAACGFSYESLPWITAAAAGLGTLPSWQIIAVALLYGLGAHGIMTLNDFKAIQGDKQMGINTLPVLYGPTSAAKIACFTMFSAQAGVVSLLLSWDRPIHAAIVAALLAVQAVCMVRFIKKPIERDVWFSAIGVGLFVSGMMTSAIALRSLNLTTIGG